MSLSILSLLRVINTEFHFSLSKSLEFICMLTLEVMSKLAHDVPIKPERVNGLSNCHRHAYYSDEEIRNGQIDQEVVSNTRINKREHTMD